MIPDFAGLIFIEHPVSVVTRPPHPPPARRTTRRPTAAEPGRRSGCPAGGMEAARPSRRAADGGPGSAEPHCPPPYSPRTRREKARQLVRQLATTGEPPPRADQRAVQIGRRDGSRRTDGAGSAKAARYGHRRWVVSPDGSGRQALATLTATGGEDGTARTGAHPKAEAVLLVPTTVVRLERPLAHWNDSGTCLEIALSTNPLIDLPLVQVLQVARETRQSARSPIERSTKRPAQHRPIHGTRRPVDRSNQPSPHFSTDLWMRRPARRSVRGSSHMVEMTTQGHGPNTTNLRRLPDTPEVSPNLASVACG